MGYGVPRTSQRTTAFTCDNTAGNEKVYAATKRVTSSTVAPSIAPDDEQSVGDHPLQRALDAEIKRRRNEGLTRTELCRQLGENSNYIYRLLTQRIARIDELARIEAHLGLPRGFFLINAGYVAVPLTLEQVIDSDGRLSSAQRLRLRKLVQVELGELG